MLHELAKVLRVLENDSVNTTHTQNVKQGTQTRIEVPRPRRERILSVPPANRTRSRMLIMPSPPFSPAFTSNPLPLSQTASRTPDRLPERITVADAPPA